MAICCAVLFLLLISVAGCQFGQYSAKDDVTPVVSQQEIEKPGASSIFFDDFEDGKLDPEWYVYDGSVSDVDETGGALHLAGPDPETRQFGDLLTLGQVDNLTGDVIVTATFEAVNPHPNTMYGIFISKMDRSDQVNIDIHHDYIERLDRRTMLSISDESAHSSPNFYGLHEMDIPEFVPGDIVTLQLVKQSDRVKGFYKVNKGTFIQVGQVSTILNDPFTVGLFGANWPPPSLGTTSYDFSLPNYEVSRPEPAKSIKAEAPAEKKESESEAMPLLEDDVLRVSSIPLGADVVIFQKEKGEQFPLKERKDDTPATPGVQMAGQSERFTQHSAGPFTRPSSGTTPLTIKVPPGVYCVAVQLDVSSEKPEFEFCQILTGTGTKQSGEVYGNLGSIRKIGGEGMGLHYNDGNLEEWALCDSEGLLKVGKTYEIEKKEGESASVIALFQRVNGDPAEIYNSFPEEYRFKGRFLSPGAFKAMGCSPEESEQAFQRVMRGGKVLLKDGEFSLICELSLFSADGKKGGFSFSMSGMPPARIHAPDPGPKSECEEMLENLEEQEYPIEFLVDILGDRWNKLTPQEKDMSEEKWNEFENEDRKLLDLMYRHPEQALSCVEEWGMKGFAQFKIQDYQDNAEEIALEYPWRDLNNPTDGDRLFLYVMITALDMTHR